MYSSLYPRYNVVLRSFMSRSVHAQSHFVLYTLCLYTPAHTGRIYGRIGRVIEYKYLFVFGFGFSSERDAYTPVPRSVTRLDNSPSDLRDRYSGISNELPQVRPGTMNTEVKLRAAASPQLPLALQAIHDTEGVRSRLRRAPSVLLFSLSARFRGMTRVSRVLSDDRIVAFQLHDLRNTYV